MEQSKGTGLQPLSLRVDLESIDQLAADLDAFKNKTHIQNIESSSTLPMLVGRRILQAAIGAELRVAEFIGINTTGMR